MTYILINLAAEFVYIHLMDEKRISSETLDREFVFEEKN